MKKMNPSQFQLPNEKFLNLFCGLVCILAVCLHFFTPFDVFFQRYFFSSGEWLIPPNEPLFYFTLYTFPKILIVFFGIVGLCAMFYHYFVISFIDDHRRVCILAFLICLALFPVFINILKEILRQPCPRDLQIFGGIYSENLLDFLVQRGNIRCFPGAHASAPFSLLSAKYFFKLDRNRHLFLIFLLPLATLISMYQVLRGVHFLTDIIFTAASAQLFVSFLFYLMVSGRAFFREKLMSLKTRF
jgi:membrane-associated PAP2 superfamily phosphatase